MRQIEPYRLEGMEIHSTVLWHLQMEVQLSALAQDLVEFDKLSPEVRRFFSDNAQFFLLMCYRIANFLQLHLFWIAARS